MAVGLEDERVALEGLGDLAAAGEAEVAVELAGVVEAEDAVGLLGEVGLGFGEEAEVGVASDDAFEVGEEVGPGLHRLGSRAVVVLVALLEFLWGFGDEEGGGEWGGEEEETVVRVRV